MSKHKAAAADAEGTKNEDSGSNVFVAGLIASEGDSCWVIDSGASQHMTANRELVVARGLLVGSLYRLDCKVDKPENQASVANENGTKLDLWH